jgi:hypothetical protein
LDPCAGNGFHTYLFKTYSNLKTISVDIQKEEDAWNDIIECDGVQFLKNYDKHFETVLLLSWIDYEELCLKLLDNFKGYMIISIGNYEEKCPNYKKILNCNYVLLELIYLIMPWGLEEKIEIYKRK